MTTNAHGIKPGPRCGDHNSRTGNRCNLHAGHDGNHAWTWTYIRPGLIRDTW